jgi:ADP-dependent NAD(P)H-hydrate dehydratase
MNRHEFELTAKKFRAGKISLSEFADTVYGSAKSSANADTDAQLPALPTRKPDSHKGTYGKVLVIGGSPGMSGAPCLSSLAALRAGAGLVVLATYDDCRDVTAGINPCIMTTGIFNTDLLDQDYDAIAIGPGFGTKPDSIALTSKVYRYAKCPLVVDADALNCLALEKTDLAHHAGPRILTPHPGEFGRLFPQCGKQRQAMELFASKTCQTNQLTIVLKGAGSFVTDGQQEYRNHSGNSGMATAGSGDVLTGVIVALTGQGMHPFPAAQLATYLHGLAGDLAIKKIGLHSLIATDLINFLPDAFCKHAKS